MLLNSFLIDKRNKLYEILKGPIGLMLILLFISSSVVYAADHATTEGIRVGFENFIEGMGLNAIKYMHDTFKSFRDIFAPPSKGGISFGSAVNAIVAVLAGAAISIYFTIDIIKEASKNPDMSVEYWQRVFINLSISLVTTLLSTRIMYAIYLLGDVIIDAFSNAVQISSLSIMNIEDSSKETIAELLSVFPGIEALPKVVSSSTEVVNYKELTNADAMITALQYLSWGPMAVAIFLMYSAIFEIKLRELFAPIATASIMVEGSRGSGARYIKKYAACYIKIAIYFLIAYLGMTLTNQFYEKALTDTAGELSINLVFCLMSNVVAAMVMMQSSGIADDIIGT